MVITLCQRKDFELFFQIMAKRCRPDPVPATQGAATLDGVINWTKIREHQQAFLLEAALAGIDSPNWKDEWKRFTADKANYTDALILLSIGPYSAVPAKRVGMEQAEWLHRSHTIRFYHECTHFICRRLFPEQKEPLWDELLADAVGLYASFGRYMPELAALFLGVSPDGYTGGRLENYVSSAENIDALARNVYRAVFRLDGIIRSYGALSPYELAVRAEADQFKMESEEPS